MAMQLNRRLGVMAMTNRWRDRAQSEHRKLNLVTTHTFPSPSLEQATFPHTAQIRRFPCRQCFETLEIPSTVQTTCPTSNRDHESHYRTTPPPHITLDIRFEISRLSSAISHISPPCRAQRYRRRGCPRTSSH
jgi:hypothetical protein